MNEDQINRMISRFLGWKLPEDFSPDAGISFKASYNENTPYPSKHEPTGTNLFNRAQADEMVRYMIAPAGVKNMTHPFDEVALDAAREAFQFSNEEDIEVALEAAWASLVERGLVAPQEPKP